MKQSVELTGIVLTAMPIGEYDKRITILTREQGKVTAFARGARRPNSRLLAATNPFTFGKFEVIEGRSAYTLIRAGVHNYFRELAEDVDAAYMGFYFLEFAGYFCQEGNDERQMLGLLYQSLRALTSPVFATRLVRAVYELKAITINGQGPEVFSCIHCRRKERLTQFSVRRGGVFCERCTPPEDAVHLQESTLYAMQFIIATPVEKLYTFQLAEGILAELEALMEAYMSYYVPHEFKSLTVWTEMTGI